MYTEDFIKRMINQAVAALLQVIGLKQAGQYQQARQVIDQALEQLFGLRPELIKALDERKLIAMLTAHEELDTGRLAVIADLFKEEGDIFLAQGLEVKSWPDYERALTLYLELALYDPEVISEELVEKVIYLEKQLGRVFQGAAGLRPETRLALLDFYEALLKLDEKLLVGAGLNRLQVSETVSQLKISLADLLD